ncbi:GNAT family N-acetyltransferase [Arthrobacter sp. zg-Y916]|uniref:GNAT family N-acetyltransferase n=1 Tax=Arthrobacter sp. zg-Y916 TaxID=2894190 RepID=UPI001E64BD77|nr:GNAT family N-acetyltransferase [Arthrobacter sp. zg-Y916]MCC9193342.1 GNAT family N-acetyltransferase [Arthrobacter sp. zg-Y916]
MTLALRRADFSDPRLPVFLQSHLDELRPTAPAESRHALDLTGLRQPSVRLWVAWDGEAIAATGALAVLESGHEELKSMRTAPGMRGRGLGRLMLGHLLEDAAARSVERVSLETGSMEFFAPARRLYESAGFVPCDPFGGYKEDPNSVFMSLTLSAPASPKVLRR